MGNIKEGIDLGAEFLVRSSKGSGRHGAASNSESMANNDMQMTAHHAAGDAEP